MSPWRILVHAAWPAVTVVVLHEALGDLVGHEPIVDPLAHFLGGAAVALLVVRAVPHARRLGRLEPVGLALLAFGLACGAAIAWEAAEWSSDVLLGTNVQRGLGNTMRDLLLGALGAGGCAVAHVASRSECRHRRMSGLIAFGVLTAAVAAIACAHLVVQRTYFDHAAFFAASTARDATRDDPGVTDAELRAAVARELRQLSDASVTSAHFARNGDFVDPWGSRPRFEIHVDSSGTWATCRSPGPDRRLNTWDDVVQEAR